MHSAKSLDSPRSRKKQDPCSFKSAEIESSITERFDAIVEQYPDAVAISHEGTSWSYRELAQRADNIARFIWSHGHGRQPIALAGQTNPLMAAAILATFRIGQPFVFIGPEIPDKRAEHILAETSCTCVFCGTHSDIRAPFHNLGLSILTDEERENCRDQDDRDLPTPGPDNLAYIVFTSGSTGRPKGVPQTHRAVLADIRRQGNDLGTTPDDVYGLLYSFGGSAAICHLGGSLLHGARLTMFDLRSSGFQQLASWLEEERVSILDINVSTFRQLCRSLSPSNSKFPALRLLAPGSEPVHRYDIELFERHFSEKCVLQNAFGTSETRTVTQYFITHGMAYEHDGENVSIGAPVDGKEVILLNEKGDEVEEGEVGELVVRSRYIAPGYWNQPTLSKDRFRPDSSRPDHILYFTNDLARRLPSGKLVHLGRRDFSAKINGLLVAYAEVEAAVRSHPKILDAAIVAVNRPDGTNVLACFAIADPGEGVTLRSLRDHLGEILSPQMIPTIFRFQESLPQLQNGKLNRRALIDSLEQVANRKLTTLDQPRPGIETEIAEAYSSVLGCTPVGRNDHFFDLGGDSLLALALTNELQKKLKTRVPVIRVVDSPTPAALASFLLLGSGQSNAESAPCHAIQLSSASTHRPLYLVPGERSIGSEFDGLVEQWRNEFSITCLQHAGMDRCQIPDSSIEEAAKKHMQALTALSTSKSITIIGNSFGALLAYELARLLAESGKTAHAILLDYPNQTGIPRPSDFKIGDMGLRARFELLRRTCAGKSVTKKGALLTQYARDHLKSFYRRRKNLRSSQNKSDRPALSDEEWLQLVRDSQKRAARRFSPLPTKAHVTVVKASQGLNCNGALPECGMGWKPLVKGHFKLVEVDGDHFMLSQSRLSSVLPVLKSAVLADRGPLP